MKSFKEYLNEAKTGNIYKVAGGETGPNSNFRFKKTATGWDVSKDGGKTWKSATDDHPSPMYNTQDINMELEIGSIVKV